MRTDLLWRAVLTVVTVVLILVGAPSAVLAPLVLVTTLAVGERLVRMRGQSAASARSGPIDAVLVGTGGLLVTLVLLGLLLDLIGVGLHPWSWAVSLGVLALVGLALSSRRPAPPSVRPSRALLLKAPWAVAAVAVAVIAISVSVHATDGADVPPAQMSLGRTNGSSVQVVVSSGSTIGPLELRTTSPNGTTLSYPLFTVRAKGSVTTALTLPAKGRYTITLNNPNQSEPLRSLILDR